MNETKSIGDWLKISELGSGAFGVVSLWRNQRTDECLAIKMCKSNMQDRLTQRQKQRWRDEVEIMKSLCHPNIIRFLEVPKELSNGLYEQNPSNLPLLSMEYCNRGNLRHVLRDFKNGCGLKEGDVKEILADIGGAVDYLHKENITHRDIKPDNIVLQESDSRKSGLVYKLIDLGYAKDLNDTVVSFVGTLEYLAPEICMQTQYNHSVDYWSFGVIAFEIICGVVPFLPMRPLPERYEKVQEKTNDTICIYEDSLSGSLKHSDQILKYHHISNYFKQQIEFWLKHVLQFDPAKRSQPISDIPVFTYLKKILDTHIVTVFWLYKMEYYTYKIDHQTKIGDLKTWIKNDLRVNLNEILVLFSKNISAIPDDKLLINFLTNNNIVYVVHKNLIFNDPVCNPPYFVKQIFRRNWNFEPRTFFKVFSHCNYFLTKEITTLINVKKSINLFRIYVNNLREYTKLTSKQFLEKSKMLMKRIHQLVDVIQIKCDNNLTLKKEKQVWLNIFSALLNEVDSFNTKKIVLKNRLHAEWDNCDKLESVYSEVKRIMKNCDLEKHLNSINTIIVQQRSQKPETLFTNITKELGNALKTKDGFLHEQILQTYYKKMGCLLGNLEACFYEMYQLELLCNKLNETANEITVEDNFFTSIKPAVAPPTVNHLKNGIKTLNINTVDLIEENRKLMQQWDIIVNNIYYNDLFLDRF